ncbi:carboxypeptidase-like regulatory domain-containing protein [Blastopirellula marina]|uniref:Carboxypeptidase regulatory-like domain-containing protein n=1 Tax=Blastopirellula marina TaxID=124 RepID=A0A2S8FA23_9BACT|nr:carboxypeptidase-like regulatory domain-containing protein [Blastopirellula marina]PQO29026.1 hypothetical protein C5Y98_22730 [Blastopirellula marina]PTL42298.1 carboxypeptidase regulatory-like domain-containing protein [Blastopirellula marina]
MRRVFILMRNVLLLTSVSLCLGCYADSKLSAVGGAITLDGRPLPGATVTFQPLPETMGQTAMGRTDAAGRYWLKVRNKKEIAPGGYRVEVKVINEVTNKEGMVVGVKEDPKLKIDRRFNDQTTLRANVESGAVNEFNFDVSLK